MLQNRERREREMSIVAQFFMIMGGVLTGYVGIGLAAAIGKLVGGLCVIIIFCLNQTGG